MNVQESAVSDSKRAAALFIALAATLAAYLGVVWVFRANVAALVYSKDVAEFDTSVFQRLHVTASSGELQLFEILTVFGSPVAMTVFAIAGVAWLAIKSHANVVAAWIAALAGSSALSSGIKHIFDRPRPPGALEHLTGSSYSFPSSHAFSSLVGYGMLAFVMSRYFVNKSRSRLALIGAATGVVTTIALSRLILGVHYASDVCAGLLVGSIWLATCICALEYAERRQMPPR